MVDRASSKRRPRDAYETARAETAAAAQRLRRMEAQFESLSEPPNVVPISAHLGRPGGSRQRRRARPLRSEESRHGGEIIQFRSLGWRGSRCVAGEEALDQVSPRQRRKGSLGRRGLESALGQLLSLPLGADLRRGEYPGDVVTMPWAESSPPAPPRPPHPVRRPGFLAAEGGEWRRMKQAGGRAGGGDGVDIQVGVGTSGDDDDNGEDNSGGHRDKSFYHRGKDTAPSSFAKSIRIISGRQSSAASAPAPTPTSPPPTAPQPEPRLSFSSPTPSSTSSNPNPETAAANTLTQHALDSLVTRERALTRAEANMIYMRLAGQPAGQRHVLGYYRSGRAVSRKRTSTSSVPLPEAVVAGRFRATPAGAMVGRLFASGDIAAEDLAWMVRRWGMVKGGRLRL
ncbi:hypothetical protein B0T26DRAFT_693646 [Lasiosphaeria miniovina]|uniref:Uncharacterized protein n=1 Tax=Lasiosphaeria miniovina TaxID=1954250 RepID=A0AA40B4A9_9PEZI|nr:uncharacterized protein B0T26DRAFT_693646 [Lasiosphaeria miniovina]KAK0727238.1 hypothetical protein B0T26DRAFT_693646 [Lasiosphaeria miniovina]